MKKLLVVMALAGCNQILGVGSFTTAPPDAADPNTVTGTSIIDWIVFDGSIKQAPEDLSGYTIKAYIPDGMGHFDIKNGTGKADGTFQIPGVPPGTTYYLYLLYPQIPNHPAPVPVFYETNLRTIDLGYPVMGRPDGVEATRTSTLTFQLTGLTPWGDSDSLIVDSYNNGSEFTDQFPSVVSNPPAPGATTVTGYTFDWRDGYTYHPIGSLPRLVDASKGDDLIVMQEHVDIVNAGTFTYQVTRETGALEKTDLTQTDGSPLTVSGALTPITYDRSISPTYSIPAFRSQFAADGGRALGETLFASRLDNAGVQYQQRIGSGPWAVLIPPDQSNLGRVPPMGQLPPIMFGNSTVLPATWGQSVFVAYTRRRKIRAPGTTNPLGAVGMVSEFTRTAGAAVDISPAIRPVQQIMVGNVDVLGNNGKVAFDGTTGPVVTWDAVAMADGYGFSISRIYNDGGNTVRDVVLQAHTTSTTFTVPPDLLKKGQRYIIAVTSLLGLDAPGLRRVRLPEADARMFGATMIYSDACGDGVVQADLGEECDTMGESATCDSDCSLVLCGDATKNAAAGEMCDMGGSALNCNANCTPVACGDGRFDPVAEVCDDSNTNNTDGCDQQCHRTGTCGDNTVQPSVEECDPPNGTTCGPDCLSL